MVIVLMATLSLNRVFFEAIPKEKKKTTNQTETKNSQDNLVVFRGKVQGLPLQASKSNAVAYALLLFYNCRKTVKNGKKKIALGMLCCYHHQVVILHNEN